MSERTYVLTIELATRQVTGAQESGGRSEVGRTSNDGVQEFEEVDQATYLETCDQLNIPRTFVTRDNKTNTVHPVTEVVHVVMTPSRLIVGQTERLDIEWTTAGTDGLDIIVDGRAYHIAANTKLSLPVTIAGTSATRR